MEFNPLPIILAAIGIYFLIRLRFFFIIHPIRTAARGLRAVSDRRAFHSFSLALAGTLGVGNVFGVAIGIMLGGAGSLFWLFISMFFAMVIKYAEVVIAGDNLYHDADTHGGIYYVIRSSFCRFGRPLSIIYAAVTVGLSLVMGAALQSDAVIESIRLDLDYQRHILAFMLISFVLISILGGTVKIERITAVVIPLTTLIYIFMATGIIVSNIERFWKTVDLILKSAFSFKSVMGGGVSFLFSLPLREGFARGILSNEAGAGTSSTAHSRSGVLSPASAGILGIFEVWFDTGLICMLTGFSILLSVPDTAAFESGMELINYSVGNLFGTSGKYMLLFCIFAFAFATVICWYYYGSEAWSNLFGKGKRALFLPIFILFVYIGAFLDTMVLVFVTDLLMLLATLLTLSALIKNSDRIIDLSESGGVIDSERIRLRRLRVKSIRIKGNESSREARRR